ncbi:unnamed protein product [Microthlaspi erraticum]|uniref:Uncharacterized protein n=1 Tax=Microthlaspi erraticum TaxID=1685480 RepID=A0A6D2JVQ7_9BRAS|nr:unnamed protein product [Microthlaspi erraticum]
MDFIKTSSLRALIELTFQRNWNGIIWMSRKGVIAKRVETVQTALSREQRPKRALGQSCVRPTEVSAKVQTTRPITHHDPGNIARGRPSHNATPHRARPKRASRETPRGRATPPYHARTLRPSRETPASGRDFIGQVHPPTTPTDRESVRPRPFRLGHDPMSGRSSRTTVPTPRSTRSPFEAQTYVFKPGLTLAASRKT